MKAHLRHFLYTLMLIVVTIFSASAQVKIGNNPATINANSVLEVESTNKGLLLPRVTLTSTSATSPLTAHIAGMTVYNTATANDVVPAYYYNDGTRWVQIANAATFWSITGNANTSPGSSTLGAAVDGNYWGTSNAQNLVVGTNGIKRMIFDQRGNAYGGSNTSVTSTTSTNSFAWGSGNTVGGESSATFGIGNSNLSKWALVIGNNNSLDAGLALGSGRTNRGTILAGGSNTVSGGENYNSIISGSQVTVSGTCFESLIIGFQTTVTNSQKVVVSGQNHVVTNALGSAVFGNFNATSAAHGLISGAGQVINAGADGSVALGGNNNIGANSAYGVALGQSNTVAAGHINSMAIGKGVTTTAAAQFASSFAGGYNFYTNTANSTGVALAASGTTFTSISDRRSKENISNLGYGLKTVMALRPTQYNYKGVTKTSLGFIAQEVKTVLPEVVEQTSMGPNHDYLGIKYAEIIPVLTKAIQELKIENDQVKAKNASLVTEVARMKAGMQELAALTRQVQEIQVALGVKKENTTPAATVSATKAPVRSVQTLPKNNTK